MADKTVQVTYNRQTGKVIVPSSTISINKRSAKIEFDLNCNPPLPAGHSAKVKGIEFAKPGEPGGNYAPSKVFGNGHSATMNGANHTIYGTAKVGAPKNLVLTDNNNVTAASGSKEYGFKVWIELDDDSGNTTHVEGYKSSDDPKIKNEDPPPTL